MMICPRCHGPVLDSDYGVHMENGRPICDECHDRGRTNDTRAAHAFANVETMTREELIDFCEWNDRNGCYSDEDTLAELGYVLETETLRQIVRQWAAGLD